MRRVSMLEACARPGDEGVNVSWELTESKDHILA